MANRGRRRSLGTSIRRRHRATARSSARRRASPRATAAPIALSTDAAADYTATVRVFVAVVRAALLLVLAGPIGCDAVPVVVGAIPAADDAGSVDRDDASSGPAIVDGGTDPASTDAGSDSVVVDTGSDPVVVDAGGDPAIVDAGGPPPPPPPPPPRGPAELVVLTANVENLPRTSDGCPGDFRDLYAYLEDEGLRPDVFFVQQLSGQAQLDELLALLSTQLQRPYAGRVAEANPTPFQSPCGAQKERQTNAVVFATDRMAVVGDPIVRPSYKNVDGTCVLDTLSRTRTLALLLRDGVTGEDVSATSLHWSTRNGPGPDPACATANARELDQIVRVHHGGAALFLAGGDTNEPDLVEHTTTSTFQPWYTAMNVDLDGSLGWLDPIWRHCAATGALRSCLVNQWTFRGATDRRIDFVFTRGPTAVPTALQAHTITFNEAGAADRALTGSDSDVPYSDHRAVWARLQY
jgi:hypothetical protein